MIISDREITKDELQAIHDDFKKIEIKNGVPQIERKRYSYTAEENNIVIGFVSGLTHHDWFCLSDLWVHEDFRSQGLGTKLLSMLEDSIKTIGMKHIYGWTHGASNFLFYEKQGYRAFTVFENYHGLEGYHLTGLIKDFLT